MKMEKGLAEFATLRQLEYLEALEKHGSITAAAKALGVARGSMQDSLRHLKKKAAQRDGTLHRTPVAPDGYLIKGASTYFDKEGRPAGQWVKTTIDTARQDELMRAAVAALSKDVRGLAPLTAAPKRTDADLLAVYPLGDPHFGMYAWAKEAGADFDLKTARRLTMGAVDRLVSSAPPAHTALILPLGDVFHANDQTNQTPAHKHQLDVDSRFVHVLGVGIETFRHCVLRALEKHARVIVRFVAGNHDPQAVWALAFTIAAYFDSDPRVDVDLSPAAHWFHRFGKVLIGATHGDRSKPEQLPGVMACDRAQDWGQAKHRYWYCGHVHHSSVREFPGVTVETARTLAASDAYAAGHGYRAGRDMRAIIIHREHGEVERHRCDVGMLQEAA